MTKIYPDVPAIFRRAQLFRFIRHFLEMVVAMAAGMAILGPLRALVVAYSDDQTCSAARNCTRWRWPST